jgi:hypothetical protein
VADWKGFMLPFISSLLGSSLIVSMVTNVMQTWNKPEIAIDSQYIDSILVEPEGQQSDSDPDPSPVVQSQYGFSDTSTDLYSRLYEITIMNKGTARAESLYLTVSHPNAEELLYVKNKFTPTDIEDWKVNKESRTAVSNLSSLEPGARVTVQTNYTSSIGIAECLVTVQYKGGYKEAEPCLRSGLGGEIGPQLLIIIPLIVSGAVTGGILIYKEIRKRTKDNGKNKYVRNIIQEITRFHGKLRSKSSTQSIFNSKLWDSKGINERREIFNNYDDYKKIEHFYDRIDRRHSAFLQKDINDDLIEKHNKECLSSADVVTQIDWRRYGIDKFSISKTNTIVKVLLGSVFLTYACESGFYFFFSEYSLYTIFGNAATLAFLVLLFSLRGSVSFLISILILRTSNLIYNVNSDGGKINMLQIVRSTRLGLAKLLFASVTIMGVSILFVVPFSVEYLEELLRQQLNPYVIIAFGMLADAPRLYILAFTIPRRIARRKDGSIKQSFLSKLRLKNGIRARAV